MTRVEEIERKLEDAVDDEPIAAVFVVMLWPGKYPFASSFFLCRVTRQLVA